jgi:hypothetical protein
MMIGHGSSPNPLRSETMTATPTTVTVGTARPMLTANAAASSPRRWWASTAPTGTAMSTTTRSATAECQTVSHIWSGMLPALARAAASVNHSITLVGSFMPPPACGPTVSERPRAG